LNLGLLSTEAMLAHSTEWLECPEIRAVLDVDPLSRSMLVKVEDVHLRLSRQQIHRSLSVRLVARLRDELEQLDGTHDRKARAVYFALSALLHGLDDAERVAAFSELRDSLFPDGLTVVNRSYLDEAGEALELEERTTEEMLALMRSLPFGAGTLADVFGEWIAAGKALGRKVQERARVQASLAVDGSAAVDIDVRAARSLWARTVGTFLRVLELLDLPAESLEAVVSPLQASVKAAMATRRRVPAVEPEPVVEPETVPEPETVAEPEPSVDESFVGEAAVEAGFAAAGSETAGVSGEFVAEFGDEVANDIR